MMSDQDCVVRESLGNAISTMQESTRQRLERTKQSLESRIEDINEALALFEKFPEMEKLQDLLRRI